MTLKLDSTVVTASFIAEFGKSSAKQDIILKSKVGPEL